ncbi:MAG TPA: VOC family protein [Acidimicrobiia bacterium]|nr:VOC family protein [Acidimicrobiia bacterium]
MLRSARLVAFVPSTDLARARAFFGDVLGLPLVHEDEFACVFDAGGTPLRVTRVEQLVPAPFTVLGWSVPDARAAARDLAARGVELLRVEGIGQDADGVWSAPGGAHVVWFLDPDGNTLSVTEGA